MAERSTNRFWAVALVMILVVAGVGVAVILARGTAPTTQAAQAGVEDTGDVLDEQVAPSVAPLSPEEQARHDLDQLVREYYAAEDAVFLDPATDPSAAFDRYLVNPASGARIAKVLSLRTAGDQLNTSLVEVHSVVVSQLDWESQLPTAQVQDCHTTTASGVDGTTGEASSFSNRRQTTWTAVQLPDGSWRLKTFQSGDVGSC